MDLILDLIPYLLLGIFTGVYGTVVGVGGGTVLTPVLLIVFGLNGASAAGTSLTLVAINSISGAIGYCRAGLVDVKSGYWFAIAAIPGSVVAPFFITTTPDILFKLLLGVLLLLLAALLILRPGEVTELVRENELVKVKNGANSHGNRRWNRLVAERSFKSRRGDSFRYSFNIYLATSFNVVLGFMSSFFGTGGGFIRTPLLISWFGFPVTVAAATSIFALSIYASFGGAIHILRGNVEWYPVLVWSGAGLIIGSQLGVRLATFVNSKWITKVLALVLVVVGLQLVTQGIWADIPFL